MDAEQISVSVIAVQPNICKLLADWHLEWPVCSGTMPSRAKPSLPSAVHTAVVIVSCLNHSGLSDHSAINSQMKVYIVKLLINVDLILKGGNIAIS